MAFLTMAVKLIWLTVLFLVGCVVMMVFIVAGFTYAVKVIEDIRNGNNNTVR